MEKVLAVNKFPPLSEKPLLRYVTFILLYFSQGIPEGITIFAIPAWMAMNGKDAVDIAAYSAIIIIPFSLKILLAPMMERYTYLPMGRRRPWLLFGQLGILGSLIALSFVPHPLHNIMIVTTVAVCVHIFVIFQDIATDSLVIDIVPLEQQGKANSFMWGSKTVGTSISLFGTTWLISRYGFSNAVLAMCVSVFVIMFVPLLLRERRGEKLVPWSHGQVSPEAAFFIVDSWSKLFRSFRQVILLNNCLLMLMMVFITMAALHYLRTMLPIFTIQELGWSNIFYSKVYATSNLTGGVIGMIAGAVIIQKFGVVRLIQGSLLLISILVLSMSFLTSLWQYINFVSGFIAVFCTLLTLINIGVLALAMQLTWKRISAIQFTFCMTIFNAGLATGAALLGYLRPFFGWQMLLAVFSLVTIIAMIILKYINTSKHRSQVETLEMDYVQILKAEGGLLVKSEPN